MTEDPERNGVRRFLAFLKGAKTVPRSRWTARQVWRPTPGSLVSLLVGLWLFGTGEAVTFGATTETIGLRFDERRGVTLHSHTHHVAERHHLRIRHPELFGELVHP